jgi:hypothetical protein
MAAEDAERVARDISHRLADEFSAPLREVGVKFRLRLARRLRGGGLEQGLVLEVWPESGFDNYFEVWRTNGLAAGGSWLRCRTLRLDSGARRSRTREASPAEGGASATHRQ